jgi:hemerythrin HHE cation binding domain-containing protein
MSIPTTPSHILAALAAQHAALRDRIERCEDLADGLDAGTAGAPQLLHEVAELRIAFDAHNQFEERLLRPMLLDADWFGAVRVSRMIEDHVLEHRSMRRELETPTSSELRRVLASLRAHLDSEEHTFLSARVLRDDLAR